MRENLQKQLQEIMSATKMATGRRASARLSRMGSGGVDSAPHTPEASRVGRNGNRRTLEALRSGVITKKRGNVGIKHLDVKHLKKNSCIWDNIPYCPALRVSREAAMDINTEPSQSEQIIWDDPTAREERAKLADNLQWPSSHSQDSEPLPPPPIRETGPQFKDSMTDSELVEMGKRSRASRLHL